MPVYVGTNRDDLLVGSSFDDVIVGYDGNDSIDDGGSGADELIGGPGNDQYFVRDNRGSVIESAGEGYDTVNTNLNRYTLPNNVERLVYVGTGNFVGIGNTGDNDIVGGIGDDSLAGGTGNDTLRGGAGNDLLNGEAGLDTMIGGTGNDFYYIDSTGDSVIENANEGTDRTIVASAVTLYTLPANIEQLTYSGGQTFYGYGNASDNLMVGGTGQDWLFGYDGADILVGGAGDDRLYGGPGAANVLIGGVGNDYYFVENTGDTIVEYVGEGTDRVLTALNYYVLPANVEELYFTGTGSFFGTALGAVIVGGGANDYLTGGRTMYGGRGDDFYYVYGGESVIENPGEGTDTMIALESNGLHTLGPNVENFLSSAYFGVGAVGNALDNVMYGTLQQTYQYLPSGASIPNPGSSLSGLDGNDTLIGGGPGDTLIGGNGNDQLIGGAGADLFRYFGGETGYDRIADFTPGSDRISLSATGFSHTLEWVVVSGSNPMPNTTTSTFLYNPSTGLLSYDPDGTGAAAAVLLAQLNTGLTLAVSDFIIA